MQQPYIQTTNKTYNCFKYHLMLFVVKLGFFVHKNLQLQVTLQLCGIHGSFQTAFMDLEPVPD